jgi:hypothetical protein
VSELVWEVERAMMELESAYNAMPHLYVVLTSADKECADRELRERLRQLSLLCALLRSELEKIERVADEIRKSKRWGW